MPQTAHKIPKSFFVMTRWFLGLWLQRYEKMSRTPNLLSNIFGYFVFVFPSKLFGSFKKEPYLCGRIIKTRLL
jgi:hypothetical protein